MKFKSKKLTIVVAVIAILIIAAIAAVFLMRPPEVEAKVINEEASEYMITDVPQDYSFKVNLSHKRINPDELKVYDIYGNEVATKNKISSGTATIKAPQGGYEKGAIYTFDITDMGTFEDEAYQDAKQLLFIIEQENTTEIVYQDDVIELDEVAASGNTITLDGEYQSGDIIVADCDGNGIDEIFKLSDVEVSNGQTEAAYTLPEADEVYKSVNIFYYDEVDFTEAKIDKDAFIGILNETGILEAFIDEVYAAQKANIKVDVSKGEKSSYDFIVTLSDPRNENRQLNITFNVKDKLLFKRDDNLSMIDNTLTITSGLEFSVIGENAKATEQEIKSAMKNYQLKKSSGDNLEEYKVPLVPITIPIFGPVSAYVNLGLVAEVEYAASFNAGVHTDISFAQGLIYNTKKNKVQKKYADITTGELEGQMLVEGNLNAFAGIGVNAGAQVPLLVEIGIDTTGGTYLDSSGCFIVKGIPNNINSSGYYDIEIGLMLTANAKVQVLVLNEISIPLVEAKKPIYTLSGEHGKTNKKQSKVSDDPAIYEAYYNLMVENEDAIRSYNWQSEAVSEYIEIQKPVALCDINNDTVPELFFFSVDTSNSFLAMLNIYSFYDGAVKKLEYTHTDNSYFSDVSAASCVQYVVYKGNTKNSFLIYSSMEDENAFYTMAKYKVGKDGAIHQNTFLEHDHLYAESNDAFRKNGKKTDSKTYDSGVKKAIKSLDEVIIYSGHDDTAIWKKFNPDDTLSMSYDEMISYLYEKAGLKEAAGTYTEDRTYSMIDNGQEGAEQQIKADYGITLKQIQYQ